MHNTKRMTPPPSFSQVFAELKAEGTMSPLVARRVFDSIFAGGWTPVQIGAFLVALELLGPSSGVMTAAAKAMRARMVEVKHALPLVFDMSSVGAGARASLHVSTAAAIIVAAAGVPVALHGLRSTSQRPGAAEVLGALGVEIELPAGAAEEVLHAASITFLNGSEHHPALKYAAAPRRELGLPTIVDLLGPLTNPASATHQLIGAPSDELRPPLAAALGALGSKRAWVVRAEDGLDDVSPCGATRVSVLAEGKVEDLSVTPEDFGLPRSSAQAIEPTSAADNARVLRDVLTGQPHAARGAVLLNAAASLVVARGLGLREAAELARDVIDGGRARVCLDGWRAATRAAARAARAPT